jgi:hypothetical protein
VLRLHAIVDLMNQIQHWLPHVKQQKMAQALEIADYNKKLFFSDPWQESIINEYRTNFVNAMTVVTQNITAGYTRKLQELNPDPVKNKIRQKIFELADTVKAKFTR